MKGIFKWNLLILYLIYYVFSSKSIQTIKPDNRFFLFSLLIFTEFQFLFVNNDTSFLINLQLPCKITSILYQGNGFFYLTILSFYGGGEPASGIQSIEANAKVTESVRTHIMGVV